MLFCGVPFSAIQALAQDSLRLLDLYSFSGEDIKKHLNWPSISGPDIPQSGSISLIMTSALGR